VCAGIPTFTPLRCRIPGDEISPPSESGHCDTKQVRLGARVSLDVETAPRCADGEPLARDYKPTAETLACMSYPADELLRRTRRPRLTWRL